MHRINRGVKIPTIKAKDYILGVTSKIPYEERCYDWEPYLSEPRNQFNKKIDTQGCVSFSAVVEGIEMQMNWMKDTGKFSTRQIKEMTELGYFVNDKFRFSPLFLANVSGTDYQGNTQNEVAETVRTIGLVPESDFPLKDKMTWNEAYKKVPQELLDKAKKLFNFITIQYEWVIVNQNSVANYKAINQTITKELLHAPLQFTAPLCDSYHNRKANVPCIKCTEITPEHAMIIYGIKDIDGYLHRKVFDTYPPYKILLANNYPIPYIMKILASHVHDDRAREEVFHNEHPELDKDITEEVYNFRRGLFKFFYKLFTGKEYEGK